MIRTIKNWYHLGRSLMAALFLGLPQRKLKVIGVTGTDGKTTTATLIYHILRESGKKVSLISTVYAKIGTREFSTGLHTTTPDGVTIQRLLAESVDHGDEYFVLETTSHALDQNRNFGIRYTVAVLTNVTHEHLDYHKTFDAYIQAKAKLFTSADLSLLNRDDESYQKMSAILRPSRTRIKTYGLKHRADFDLNMAQGTGLDLSTYNTYNFLAAYAVGRSLGLSHSQILTACTSYRFPQGRMQIVYDHTFRVVIDFAHTPNAIDQALHALKERMKPGGKLIHVFGSAGLRDASKRPLMGEASAKWADVIIITEEDYRTEDPMAIANAIGEGIRKSGKRYSVSLDRNKAIGQAIKLARKNDVVVITGKGHEKSLCRGNKEYPWDEVKAVRDALQTYRKK